jgi:KaiC/GvpD/RAD55 family RecA-like ATPase
MQTERVTFLTTRDHKTALDAYAANSGMSVGHVVREATAQYIVEPKSADEEEQLSILVHELNEAVPRMRADIDEAIASIERANAIVDAVLAGEARRA